MEEKCLPFPVMESGYEALSFGVKLLLRVAFS
jgi:hypothetical protein